MIADLQKQLGIDATFFPQLIIFFIVFNGLRYIYFSPYLQLILKREAQSGGLGDDAVALDAETDALEAKHRAALSEAKKQAMDEKDRFLAGVKKEADEVVNKSKEAAKQKIDQARAAAAKHYKDDLAATMPQAEAMTKILVDKLINTKVRL